MMCGFGLTRVCVHNEERAKGIRVYFEISRGIETACSRLEDVW